MGFTNSKERIDYATVTVNFETNRREYDTDNPIAGTIEISSDRVIPAFGVQVTLFRRENTHLVAEHEEVKKKHLTWEHSFLVHTFENDFCPAGVTTIPFRVEIPPDLARS